MQTGNQRADRLTQTQLQQQMDSADPPAESGQMMISTTGSMAPPGMARQTQESNVAANNQVSGRIPAVYTQGSGTAAAIPDKSDYDLMMDEMRDEAPEQGLAIRGDILGQENNLDVVVKAFGDTFARRSLRGRHQTGLSESPFSAGQYGKPTFDGLTVQKMAKLQQSQTQAKLAKDAALQFVQATNICVVGYMNSYEKLIPTYRVIQVDSQEDVAGPFQYRINCDFTLMQHGNTQLLPIYPSMLVLSEQLDLNEYDELTDPAQRRNLKLLHEMVLTAGWTWVVIVAQDKQGHWRVITLSTMNYCSTHDWKGMVENEVSTKGLNKCAECKKSLQQAITKVKILDWEGQVDCRDEYTACQRPRQIQYINRVQKNMEEAQIIPDDEDAHRFANLPNLMLNKLRASVQPYFKSDILVAGLIAKANKLNDGLIIISTEEGQDDKKIEGIYGAEWKGRRLPTNHFVIGSPRKANLQTENIDKGDFLRRNIECSDMLSLRLLDHALLQDIFRQEIQGKIKVKITALCVGLRTSMRHHLVELAKRMAMFLGLHEDGVYVVDELTNVSKTPICASAGRQQEPNIVYKFLANTEIKVNLIELGEDKVTAKTQNDLNAKEYKKFYGKWIKPLCVEEVEDRRLVDVYNGDFTEAILKTVEDNDIRRRQTEIQNIRINNARLSDAQRKKMEDKMTRSLLQATIKKVMENRKQLHEDERNKLKKISYQGTSMVASMESATNPLAGPLPTQLKQSYPNIPDSQKSKIFTQTDPGSDIQVQARYDESHDTVKKSLYKDPRVVSSIAPKHGRSVPLQAIQTGPVRKPQSNPQQNHIQRHASANQAFLPHMLAKPKFNKNTGNVLPKAVYDDDVLEESGLVVEINKQDRRFKDYEIAETAYRQSYQKGVNQTTLVNAQSRWLKIQEHVFEATSGRLFVAKNPGNKRLRNKLQNLQAVKHSVQLQVTEEQKSSAVAPSDIATSLSQPELQKKQLQIETHQNLVRCSMTSTDLNNKKQTQLVAKLLQPRTMPPQTEVQQKKEGKGKSEMAPSSEIEKTLNNLFNGGAVERLSTEQMQQIHASVKELMESRDEHLREHLPQIPNTVAPKPLDQRLKEIFKQAKAEEGETLTMDVAMEASRRERKKLGEIQNQILGFIDGVQEHEAIRYMTHHVEVARILGEKHIDTRALRERLCNQDNKVIICSRSHLMDHELKMKHMQVKVRNLKLDNQKQQEFQKVMEKRLMKELVRQQEIIQTKLDKAQNLSEGRKKKAILACLVIARSLKQSHQILWKKRMLRMEKPLNDQERQQKVKEICQLALKRLQETANKEPEFMEGVKDAQQGLLLGDPVGTSEEPVDVENPIDDEKTKQQKMLSQVTRTLAPKVVESETEALTYVEPKYPAEGEHEDMQVDEQAGINVAGNANTGTTAAITEEKATAEKSKNDVPQEMEERKERKLSPIDRPSDLKFGTISQRRMEQSDNESMQAVSTISKRSRSSVERGTRINQKKKVVNVTHKDRAFRKPGGTNKIPKEKVVRTREQQKVVMQQLQQQMQSCNIHANVVEDLNKQLDILEEPKNLPANDLHDKIGQCYNDLQNQVKRLSDKWQKEGQISAVQYQKLSTLAQDQKYVNGKLKNIGLLDDYRISQPVLKSTNLDLAGNEANNVSGRLTQTNAKLHDELMQEANADTKSENTWVKTGERIKGQMMQSQQRTVREFEADIQNELEETLTELTRISAKYEAETRNQQKSTAEESKAAPISMKEVNKVLEDLDANWKENIVDVNVFVNNIQVELQDRVVQALERDVKQWLKCLRSLNTTQQTETTKNMEMVSLFESMHVQAMPNAQITTMLNDIMEETQLNVDELQIREERRDEVIKCYLSQNPKTRSLKLKDIPTILRTELANMIAKQVICRDTFQPVAKWNDMETQNKLKNASRKRPRASKPKLAKDPEELLEEDRARPEDQKKWPQIDYEHHGLRKFRGKKEESDISDLDQSQIEALEEMEKNSGQALHEDKDRQQLKRNWNILQSILQKKYNRTQNSSNRNEWARIYRKSLSLMSDGHRLGTTEGLLNLDHVQAVTKQRQREGETKVPDDSQFARISDEEMQQRLNEINTEELSINQAENVRPQLNSQNAVVKTMEDLFWRASDDYLDAFINTVMVNELFSVYSVKDHIQSPAYQIWLEFLEIASQAEQVLRQQVLKLRQNQNQDDTEEEWSNLLEATKIIAVMSPEFCQAAVHGNAAQDKPTRRAFQLSRLLANVYPRQKFGMVQPQSNYRAKVFNIKNNMETHSIHPEFLVEESMRYRPLTEMEARTRQMQSQIRGFEGLGLGFDSSHPFPELMLICRLHRDHSLKPKESEMKKWIQETLVRQELLFMAEDKEVASKIQKLEKTYRNKVINKLLGQSGPKFQHQTLRQQNTQQLLSEINKQVKHEEYQQFERKMSNETRKLLNERVYELMAERATNKHFIEDDSQLKDNDKLQLLPAIEVTARIKHRIEEAVKKQKQNSSQTKEMTTVLGLLREEQGYGSIMDILDTSCPVMMTPTVSRLVEATLRKALKDQSEHAQQLVSKLFFMDLLSNEDANDENQREGREEIMARCRAACDIMNNVNSQSDNSNENYELLDALDWYLRVHARAYRSSTTTVKMEAMFYYFLTALDTKGPYHQSIYGNVDADQSILDSIDLKPLPPLLSKLPGAQLLDALNALAGRVCFITIDSYLRAIKIDKKEATDEEYAEIKDNRGPSLVSKGVLVVKQGSEIGKITLQREMQLNVEQTEKCRKNKLYMLCMLNQTPSNRLILEICYEYKTLKQTTVNYFTVIKSRKHGLQVRIPEYAGYTDYDDEVHQMLTQQALSIRVISGVWQRETLYEKELTVMQRILEHEIDNAKLTNPDLRVSNMDILCGLSNRNQAKLIQQEILNKQELKEAIRLDSYDKLSHGETDQLPSVVTSRAQMFRNNSTQEHKEESIKVLYKNKNFSEASEFLKMNDVNHAHLVAEAIVRAFKKCGKRQEELENLIHQMATSNDVDMSQIQMLEELIRETEPDAETTKQLILKSQRRTDQKNDQYEESKEQSCEAIPFQARDSDTFPPQQTHETLPHAAQDDIVMISLDEEDVPPGEKPSLTAEDARQRRLGISKNQVPKNLQQESPQEAMEIDQPSDDDETIQVKSHEAQKRQKKE